MADEGCGGIAYAKDAAHGLTHVCHACGNGRCVGGVEGQWWSEVYVSEGETVPWNLAS